MGLLRMVERGLKTLKLQLRKHGDNAKKLFEFLVSSPYGEGVYNADPKIYESDWIHKQMKDSNGMISFSLRGGSEFAKKVLQNLKIIAIAESYAGCESLICIP